MTPVAKLLSAFAIVAVALFVLATGRTNVHNYQQVQQSIEEIYEDRLVVKRLIFELSNLLHRKELAQVTGDTTFYAEENPTVDEDIAQRIAAFRATTLTPGEARTLQQLERHLDALQAAERALQEGPDPSEAPDLPQTLADLMDALRADLLRLSEIQIEEGRRKVILSDAATSDMAVIERIEGVAMVTFAAMLIGLFFLPARPESAA